MSYEPGVVEQRVARKIGVKVSDVMDFLDVYCDEVLRFQKEQREIAAFGLDSDDANLADHTARTVAEAEIVKIEAEVV